MLKRLTARFAEYDWERLGWVVAIAVGLILIVGSFFYPAGEDIYVFYLPFANGCLTCGFVPYYAYWLLFPLSLVPAQLVWPLVTTIFVVGLLVLCRVTKVNPALVIASFPGMGQMWLGQIDILVGAGLVLGYFAANPYLRGLGILLALVKPQLSWLAVLVLLAQTPRRLYLKVLLVPVIVIGLSFAVFGMNWPLEWVANTLQNIPYHIWRFASDAVWPWGLLSLLLVFLFKSPRPRFEAALVISSLATPFYNVYSYFVFLLFRAPWWALPLSYAWALLYPLLGKQSMSFAWILPVGLLADLVSKELKRQNPQEV